MVLKTARLTLPRPLQDCGRRVGALEVGHG